MMIRSYASLLRNKTNVKCYKISANRLACDNINKKINILKKDQFKNGIHLSLRTYRLRDMGERTHQGHPWI